jgi:hypothetical protein
VKWHAGCESLAYSTECHGKMIMNNEGVKIQQQTAVSCFVWRMKKTNKTLSQDQATFELE